MRSLNLDQLKALLEVVELGSFSAAARRLNLTQPAVSLQIRELESRLAVPLVKRVGKRAYATPAGEELIAHARNIFDSTNRALAAVRRHRDGCMGRVHIGSGLAALSYILLPVLQKLRADYPEIELAVSSGNTSEITERMLKNTIDLGFTGLPVDERQFGITVIRDMEIVAILPAGEREMPDAITPDDIARRPLIMAQQRSNYTQLCREWLRAAGLDIRPAMEIDSIEVTKTVVAAGLGVSLIPREAVGLNTDDIVVRPLDPPLSLSLGLIKRRNAPEDRALCIVQDAILTLRSGVAAFPTRPRELTRQAVPTLALQ